MTRLARRCHELYAPSVPRVWHQTVGWVEEQRDEAQRAMVGAMPRSGWTSPLGFASSAQPTGLSRSKQGAAPEKAACAHRTCRSPGDAKSLPAIISVATDRPQAGSYGGAKGQSAFMLGRRVGKASPLPTLRTGHGSKIYPIKTNRYFMFDESGPRPRFARMARSYESTLCSLPEQHYLNA